MTATGTVTASSLNVRSGPGTVYSIVGSLPEGCVTPITGKSGGWYRIQYGTTTAWISAQYINITEQEDDDMDVNRFKELWQEMRRELQDNDASQYSEETRQWAVDTGLVTGGSEDAFNGMWEDVLTRE